MSEKDSEIATREQAVRDKEKQIAEEKRSLDTKVADQVAEQLRAERARVIAEESKKARLASAAELEARAQELRELQEVLKGREEKLAEGAEGPGRHPQEAA